MFIDDNVPFSFLKVSSSASANGCSIGKNKKAKISSLEFQISQTSNIGHSDSDFVFCDSGSSVDLLPAGVDPLSGGLTGSIGSEVFQKSISDVLGFVDALTSWASTVRRCRSYHV